MHGKRAIHVAKQGHGVQPEGPHRAKRKWAAGAVASVHCKPKVRATEVDVGHGVFDVGRHDVDVFEPSSVRIDEGLVLHRRLQLDDVFAEEGALAHHHLEAVLVGGVVAARDLHAAFEVEMVDREVEKRGWARPMSTT